MSAWVACMVCAPPLDALLVDGVHAGVAVLAVVVTAVLAGGGRGVLRLLREDRNGLAEGATEDPR